MSSEIVNDVDRNGRSSQTGFGQTDSGWNASKQVMASHDPERLMLRTPSPVPLTALALSLSSLSLTAVGSR